MAATIAFAHSPSKFFAGLVARRQFADPVQLQQVRGIAEPQIVAFADIGDYIREPLRTYSSGMVLHLAFSTAVHSNPSVLIVDEVIGVGDAAFHRSAGSVCGSCANER